MNVSEMAACELIVIIEALFKRAHYDEDAVGDMFDSLFPQVKGEVELLDGCLLNDLIEETSSE